MNKSAIKNFAIWARNKLIADISYKAGLLGITDGEIKAPLPQSTKDTQFFDIGSREPYQITGAAIAQRKALADKISDRAKQSDYATAYKAVIEEVAYTWFNRLIAMRFMEVNDYLPSRVRALSGTGGKTEPDIVTTPFDTGLEFTVAEREYIIACKTDNKLDELFRMLFVKQCISLRSILPGLFNSSDDESLLLSISFIDKDGLVWHLVNDIPERDFKIRTDADNEAIARGDMSEEDAPAGQVEIIGWLYQYYNTEPKAETFDLLKKNVKITKERIPAATQLFTPDWIVRYMVENSLGRLWLERHPNDELKAQWKYYLDEAEQDPAVDEQLRVMRGSNPINSPGDITFIDPCMGSGHILVYAFEVLMQIYASCGYVARDAVRLILEKNLFGYDIDLRAFQFTYFALAMKARQYDRRFLSHRFQFSGFCSVEASLIKPEHIQQLKNKEAERLYELFADAETIGSLIKVDDDIDLDALKELVLKDAPQSKQLSLDDINFQQSMAGFLGVINTAILLRKKYDVVCTNPPYMGSSGMSGRLAQFLKDYYPDSKSDLFSAFIERCDGFLTARGMQSMITMESWMFLSSFEKLREKLFATKTIINMVHMPYLGKGGTSLGINFGTAAFIMNKCRIKDYNAQYDYICHYETDKEGVPFAFPTINERYKTASVDSFAKIPGSPVAYWVSKTIIDSFIKRSINDVAIARQGMTTTDNNKYLRLWFEISFSRIGFDAKSREESIARKAKWFPYNKGGAFRKWYGNNEYVVYYFNDGKELIDLVTMKYPRISDPEFIIKNRNYYFKSGIEWSDLTTGAFSARIVRGGYIFDACSPTMFINNECSINVMLAMLNSKVFSVYTKLLCPTMHYNICDVIKVPLLVTQNNIVSKIADNCMEAAKVDWDSFETSWDFKEHPLVKWQKYGAIHHPDENENLISRCFTLWSVDAKERFYTLKRNEEELNRIFIDIYGLQDELTPEVADKDVTVARIYNRKEDIPESMKGNGYVLTRADVIKLFVSYAVGCMFGRYSLDVDGLAYAGGEWDADIYSSFIPDRDNIIPITDEEYLPDDIMARFAEFVRTVYGSGTLEENLRFIADALGGKGSTAREVIRNYFLRDFYKDHVKTYQKRPIYWLFDSGKADGFKALVYLHRYDQDTVGKLRVDYLHKLQRVYESEIARMRETIEKSGDAREVSAAQKRLEKLIKQLKEAKEYDEKIAHLALARIALDLDDGVKVNYEKLQTGTDGKKYEVLGKI